LKTLITRYKKGNFHKECRNS